MVRDNMETAQSLPQYLDEATDDLVAWCRMHLSQLESSFTAARQIVMRLGATSNGKQTEFGFWAPELDMDDNPPTVWLEIFRLADHLDEGLERQNVRFHRIRLPVKRCGPYFWAVVTHTQPGMRDSIGDFYWLRYRMEDAAPGTDAAIIRDPLAASVPYGAFGPAELYDLDGMFAARADADYFANLPVMADSGEPPRVAAPANILQLHPGTSSPEQNLAGISRIFQEIGRKLASDESLTPAEQHFVGYDAVQLTPVEPGVEFEGGPGFWQLVEDHPDSDMVTISLQRPNMTNWGYDALLTGAAAVNPVLLESKRPDELLDLIATLHTFPTGPMQVILDINLGHLDNQALDLLGEACFAGKTQYGQRVNVRQPVVRALLLEILARKLRYGADGIRIDEAQEMQWWDETAGVFRPDTELLGLMSEVSQEVAGVRYRPWMVFEDGTPWPEAEGALAYTYHEVNDRYPYVWQLGPLSLEGNVPYRQTYWLNRWWRVEEIAATGRQWVSGSANHDTLRRATQLDPTIPVNGWLGQSLPEIFAAGFDNPAVWLFTYAMLPGIPMDFINAPFRAPWTFIRNTDDRYSVKIVAEEAHFLDWAVSAEEFERDDALRRLKALGFATYDDLHRFMTVLNHVVQATEYDLGCIVEMLNAVEPPLAGLSLTEPSLRVLARAWMDDLFDYCNIWRFVEGTEPARSDFHLAVRNFRRARPWLMENLSGDDVLAYLKPCNGTVLVYGSRRAPDRGEKLLFIANLEGAPRTIVPTELPLDDLGADGWRPVLVTPGTEVRGIDQPVELENGAGIVLAREI
jgi:hypothetical protein